MQKLNSHQIVALLAAKHAEDVFIPECKTGPTHTSSDMLRLDGWAMKKSWANPCVTGYEVKVSRADFARDDKWHGYLPYCNEFYFVTPFGLLDPSEIPAPAGLMVVSSTGTILYKKKKAERRDVVIPDTVYRYILMSRIRVTRESAINDKRLQWERWMEHKTVDRAFGWSVGKSIRKAIEERVLKVEEESKEMKRRCDSYSEIQKYLASIGIPQDKYGIRMFEVRNRIDELKRSVPKGLESAVKDLQNSINHFAKNLSDLDKSEAKETTIGEVDD